jgi:hypothetical protein
MTPDEVKRQDGLVQGAKSVAMVRSSDLSPTEQQNVDKFVIVLFTQLSLMPSVAQFDVIGSVLHRFGHDMERATDPEGNTQDIFETIMASELNYIEKLQTLSFVGNLLDELVKYSEPELRLIAMLLAEIGNDMEGLEARVAARLDDEN